MHSPPAIQTWTHLPFLELKNSLIACGYKVVGDTRISSTLSKEQQYELFTVTVGMSVTGEKTAEFNQRFKTSHKLRF